MTLRKLTLTAALTVAALVSGSSAASAQVSFGAGGVQIGGGNGGTGVYVPFNGGARNAVFTGPNGGYQPSTGQSFSNSPYGYNNNAYTTQSGRTYYGQPATPYAQPAGSYYAPNAYGTTYAQPSYSSSSSYNSTYSRYNSSSYSSPGYSTYNSPYNSGYAQPNYATPSGTPYYSTPQSTLRMFR